MKIINHFPKEITEDPDMGIILPDGTRLSARVWMPVDAAENPVPAILEYLPYRKTDGTAVRDETMHPYFAGHGYACIRVDRRGCGDSQGFFDDEYSPEELRDGVDVINWIADQPWCTGKVGIQGISWGGFNGLQLAALAPEPLKAVITIGTTVDRYADDIHYKGGIQLSENIGWASTVLSWFSMPPDPAVVGDNWREMWLERLERTPMLSVPWTRHAHRDAYWKHGSVCEDFGAIKAAVLAIGGHNDGYRNAMDHLVRNLSSSVKGIAGPWGHKYPHISHIGPATDYMKEALRWWDRWLKDIDTGVEGDPAYCTYIMDSIQPADNQPHRPGFWLELDQWPSPQVQGTALALTGDGGLVPDSKPQTMECPVPFDLECGKGAGEFFTFGFGCGELPGDQTADDARSLTFTLPPGETDRIILGAPKLSLKLSSDRPRAQVIARLCDVRPDGTAMLIGHGMLNLRQRESREHPKDLSPGNVYDISFDLDQVSYRLPAGHGLRLSLSSSYWPFVWPEGERFQLTVHGGKLSLPCYVGAIDRNTMPFGEPESAPPRRVETLEDQVDRKEWGRDDETGEIVLRISSERARTLDHHTGLTTGNGFRERTVIHPDDPGTAAVRIDWERGMARGDWAVRTETSSVMRGKRDHWEIEHTITAFEGETQVFQSTYSADIPRD